MAIRKNNIKERDEERRIERRVGGKKKKKRGERGGAANLWAFDRMTSKTTYVLHES